jgi:hypothetical protein
VPAFALTGHADAAVEEVWKLLFDPSRFPEWWAGVATVRTDGHAEPGRSRVTISCQVSDIDVVWQLAERGAGTAIDVRVDLPEAESHRLASQHDLLQRSLASLARLAESAAA